MPTTPVNKSTDGAHEHSKAITVLQTFLSRPVCKNIDDQARATEVIKMQQYLVTQGKFSAGNVNKSIDDQALSAKIAELQTAANLP